MAKRRIQDDFSKFLDNLGLNVLSHSSQLIHKFQDRQSKQQLAYFLYNPKEEADFIENLKHLSFRDWVILRSKINPAISPLPIGRVISKKGKYCTIRFN